MNENPSGQRILLTGATGYIGGRLLPLLEKQSAPLRCLVRDPCKLQGKIADKTELAEGDLLNKGSLIEATRDVHTAYYLVHSMGGKADFEEKDREAAKNFAEAAVKNSVQRMIYLGGLGAECKDLSPHLRSRLEVGRILRESEVETIEFRAAVVIGAGSLSFELVRSLTNRLPVMICPRWVATPTQPIAVNDVIAYLLAAKDLPRGESRIFEIGGADVVSYGDMIHEYARQTNKKRHLIPVPVLTPYLSSLWLNLVTPAKANVARHLIEGVRNPTVVQDRSADEVFAIKPVGIREAVADAISVSDEMVTSLPQLPADNAQSAATSSKVR